MHRSLKIAIKIARKNQNRVFRHPTRARG